MTRMSIKTEARKKNFVTRKQDVGKVQGIVVPPRYPMVYNEGIRSRQFASVPIVKTPLIASFSINFYLPGDELTAEWRSSVCLVMKKE